MSAEQRVYEMDADGIVTRLMEELVARGDEVIEQVPAGVWWFSTTEDRDSLVERITSAFSGLVHRELREIRQEHA